MIFLFLFFEEFIIIFPIVSNDTIVPPHKCNESFPSLGVKLLKYYISLSFFLHTYNMLHFINEIHFLQCTHIITALSNECITKNKYVYNFSFSELHISKSSKKSCFIYNSFRLSATVELYR